MEKFLEKHQKKIVAIALSFMLAVSLWNAWRDSAIFDETAHIGAAYSYVTQREIRLNPEHPPLLKDLAGLPLLFLDLKFDSNQPFWTGELKNKWDEGQWTAGRYLLYQAGNNPDAILFFARLPIVILSVIFGFFLFKWGKELAGTSAGIFALILYAFDPNILGHNHYVTTDLGIAAFMAFAFYFYLKFIKEPAWKNVITAGIFLGLAQLAKFSSITIFPILGLATLIYPLLRVNRKKENSDSVFKLKKLGEYAAKGAAAFFISLIVVWFVYTINTSNMTSETTSRVIDANFSPAGNPSTVAVNKALHQLNNNSITRPLVEYGIGMGYVFRRVAGGNGAYFLGQVSSQAFRAYFPTVFAIKEPLPSLFFMLFALIFAFSKIARTFISSIRISVGKVFAKIFHYLRTSIVEVSLFLFVILYSYISITGNLNIGFRHLFPILPFIYLLTAKNVSEFLHRKKFVPDANETKEELISRIKETSKGNLPAVLAFAVIGGYLIIGTLIAFPYYLSYFNEIAGGPKNGYRYVTDSNADWGQDLKRLAKWIDKRNNSLSDKVCIQIYPAPAECQPIDKIRVDYFGGGDIAHYIGKKYVMWWDSKRPIEPGWYAISTNFLMGSLYDKTKKDEESYRWIKNKKSFYQVGTSILIYYVNPEEIKNLD